MFELVVREELVWAVLTAAWIVGCAGRSEDRGAAETSSGGASAGLGGDPALMQPGGGGASGGVSAGGAGAGSAGMSGSAGSGGTTMQAGAAGAGIGGGGFAGSSTDRPPCQPTPVTCDGEIYTGPLSGACAVEGATCSGFACHDLRGGYDFSVTCCHGTWYTDQPGAPCPQDSPTFQCGSVSECAVGENYCRQSLDPSAQVSIVGCESLCAAGDCSCFCDPDELGSCSFSPPESSCPFDHCVCSITEARFIPPGAVAVGCELAIEQAGSCHQATEFDAACTDAGLGNEAWLCFGDKFDGTPLPGAPAVTCGVRGTYVCW